MEKLTAKYKLNESQLAAIRQIVPEAFKDNELDFNSLYEALSDYIDDDEPDIEQYGLSWPGKRAAKRAAAIPPIGTLAPVPGDGVDEASTRNIYIEGDNLEVLKIIRKAYTGRIKMIYIDPPYNTGNDFIYPDDFSESVESYQRRTGQVDESGARMTTNNRSDGRFHSKWLSMMFPRLRLARDLLSEDGVIFISIDENEVDNLKEICNEVFGENSIDILIWRKNGKQGNTKKITRFKNTHEYIFAVYKNKESTSIGKTKLLPNWKGEKGNPDNDPRGPWESGVISRMEEESNSNSENYYTITLPSGRKMTREFFVSKIEFDMYRKNNRIYFPKDGDGVPRLKIFQNEEQEYYFDTIIDEMGTFTQAREEIADILGNKEIFDTPKLLKILKELTRTTTYSNSIILDFFSGSSTTAHAVMQLNAENSMGGGGTVNSSWCNSKNLAKKTAKPPRQVSKIFAKLARNAYVVPGKRSSRKLA
jgi:adenine-specific DNA-methyltransferase